MKVHTGVHQFALTAGFCVYIARGSHVSWVSVFHVMRSHGLDSQSVDCIVIRGTRLRWLFIIMYRNKTMMILRHFENLMIMSLSTPTAHGRPTVSIWVSHSPSLDILGPLPVSRGWRIWEEHDSQANANIARRWLQCGVSCIHLRQ